MTLTKAHVIDEVQSRLQLQKNEASHAVETLLEIIKRTLADGEDLMVSGFGKFEVNEKGARRGRNPATGDSLVLPDRRVVVFRCSGKLREKLNGS